MLTIGFKQWPIAEHLSGPYQANYIVRVSREPYGTHSALQGKAPITMVKRGSVILFHSYFEMTPLLKVS